MILGFGTLASRVLMAFGSLASLLTRTNSNLENSLDESVTGAKKKGGGDHIHQ